MANTSTAEAMTNATVTALTTQAVG
jgi:hypothetical protein